MTTKLPWVETALGVSDRKKPEMPPMKKLKNQARQNSMGTVKRIFALHRVAIPHRKMNPVGIEITYVESMENGRSAELMPLTNRWCCQTKKRKRVTPRNPATASR